MRSTVFALAVAVATIAAPCAAQSPPACFAVDGPSIRFDPSVPNASQPIAITVGHTLYNPISAVAVPQGNSINVTLAAQRWLVGTPPAITCVTATVGPLPVGSYAVNLFIIDLNSATPSPNLVGTNTVTVTAAEVATVPTMSHSGIAALVILLSAVASLMFRRRSL